MTTIPSSTPSRAIAHNLQEVVTLLEETIESIPNSSLIQSDFIKLVMIIQQKIEPQITTCFPIDVTQEGECLSSDAIRSLGFQNNLEKLKNTSIDHDLFAYFQTLVNSQQPQLRENITLSRTEETLTHHSSILVCAGRTRQDFKVIEAMRRKVLETLRNLGPSFPGHMTYSLFMQADDNPPYALQVTAPSFPQTDPASLEREAQNCLETGRGRLDSGEFFLYQKAYTYGTATKKTVSISISRPSDGIHFDIGKSQRQSTWKDTRREETLHAIFE